MRRQTRVRPRNILIFSAFLLPSEELPVNAIPHSRPLCTLLITSLCLATLSSHAADKPKAAPPADTPAWEQPQPAVEKIDLNMYMRIREEGLQHSHIMEYASALADGIGPRLDRLAQPGQG